MIAGWVTIAEAIEHTGRGRATIYRWIKAGKLKLVRGHVELAELERVDRASRQRTGETTTQLAKEVGIDADQLAEALRRIAGVSSR